MSERRIVHLIVKGRVQGVGFRAFVEDAALAGRLEGWVRNRRDGSVEAVAAGTTEQVDGFLDAVRRGPRAARVDSVDVRETGEATPGSSTKGFTVLPTV